MPSLPPLPNFTDVTPLATGGMAEVYGARALEGPFAGRQVILKRLLPLFRSEPAFVELFLSEARLGVMLVHPNIVRTLDLLHVGQDYFLVQERAPGLPLSRLLEKARAQKRPLALGAGLVAVLDLLGALAHMHAGGGCKPALPISHGDVNPDNLVVGPDGVARLIDFGLAEQQGSSSPARTGAWRGTPGYMSPEQVRGLHLDPRGDVFSAGIVLWETLSGEVLFTRDHEFETFRLIVETQAPALSTVAVDLHPAFDALLARALRPAPDERFVSAREMRMALLLACRDAGVALDRKELAQEVARAGK